MTTKSPTVITVRVTVKASPEEAWKHFNDPEAICRWNHASDDWHTLRASNDLRPGGKLSSRMEAKDGSFGFDFEGIYERVEPHRLLEYAIADGRKVQVQFSPVPEGTLVEETFEAEGTHPAEMQRSGWQAILDNYKLYTENH